MNHIGSALLTLADRYNSYGAQLDATRSALLPIVDHEIPDAGMTVDEDGNVTAPKVPLGVNGQGSPMTAVLVQQILQAQADSLQVRVKHLLTQFGETETTAAQAITTSLRDLDAYEQHPDAAPPPAGRVQAILDGTAQLPADPAALHDFWDTLTPAEKDALWQHDQYLGNRNGLPATDRDHYNRIKLDDELARARAGDPAVAGKQRDLQAIQDTIGNKPDRMLLLLDTQSGAMTHAAVGIGNPDLSANVSVSAGGLNTSVGNSLGNMVGEAANIRQVAQSQLRRLPQGDPRQSQQVASIAWIGADLPQAGLDHPGDYVDVADDGMARRGAPKLASFYDGLGAAHDGSMHLTAVGHSYGSLMTGLALQEPGRHPVDDLAVYGSPGLDVSTSHAPLLAGLPDVVDRSVPEQLGLRPGHLYEMSAHGDPVAHFNAFGPSPDNISAFTHLETGATITSDGVHREESVGHSQYPRVGGNNQLRTSGWNIAAVVSGADRPIQVNPGGGPLEVSERYAHEIVHWLTS
ncbi:alpha/beta hydrolase [Nocardia aurantia]|uniref:DUF1023 domain-containing protein n=1 Tax=Nocardia aurantia TaxID=2585199 RepID=A0A7K0DVY6_9NOCA|nr:alpha/beta hydrolase [Nocardia aurantia]MQY29482.1 hypothetical protein [Nocardia aurantia]